MLKIIKIFFLSLLLVKKKKKRVDQIKSQIYLQNINITGDSRLAYTIKNNIILASTQDAKKKYEVNIDLISTTKEKIKNSAGKITRFNLILSANLTLKNISNQKITNKSLVKNADYYVGKNHSETISSKRKASKINVKLLSEDILKFIIMSTNIE